MTLLSIVVLSAHGQFLDRATIAFIEPYVHTNKVGFALT